MTALPAKLQFFLGLVVAAVVALLAVHVHAQPEAQAEAADAALACTESPLGDQTDSAALHESPSDRQPALDLEERDGEGDLEVTPLEAYLLSRLTSEPLPVRCAADHHVGTASDWTAPPGTACRPRGPPIR